jgi:hypothetical protein
MTGRSETARDRSAEKESEMTGREADRERLEELTEVFRNYGADDPEGLARSEVEQGIPQLAVFSFAKALWACIVDEDDDHWIDQEVERAKDGPNDPCAQIGPALQEMLSKGVSRRAIADLVRVVQYGVLSHVVSVINGSDGEDVPIRGWKLYQTDEEGYPVMALHGLRDMLPQLDPTGRAMRPREPDTE